MLDSRHRVVRAGLIAGVSVIYLALIGMVQALGDILLVEDVVSLADVLILLPMAVTGLLLARPRVVDGERIDVRPAHGATAGAWVGAVAGGLVGAALLIADAIGIETVRSVFVSVTEPLVETMTFGRGLPVGALLLVVAGAAAAAGGGGLRTLPARARVPIIVGLMTVLAFGMLQDVVRVAIGQLGISTDWVYSPRFGGLTALGAIVVFVIAAAIAWGLRRPEVARMRARAASTEGGRDPVRLAGLALGALVLLTLPPLLGPYLTVVLGQVGIFLLMALGLNVVVGYAGMLNLGTVAFYAVGAYGIAVLTAAAGSGSEIDIGMNFVLALPIVLVIATVVGFLVAGPVLRLRGDYLAIVTLAFGEITRVLITSDWLSPWLGGARGLIRIPAPQLQLGSLDISFRDPAPFYYLVLGFCALAVLISFRLERSRVGRAWMAMREDEQVAEATGVSTARFKLLAFGVGAAVGGLSGALFAAQIGSLSPASFGLLVSIQALAIVILGGIGSIPGVVLGAFVLIGLPGFLSEFEEFQLLIYGAALIAIMLLRPQGLLPNVRRGRELAEEERAQDQWAKGHEGEAEDTVASAAAAREAT